MNEWAIAEQEVSAPWREEIQNKIDALESDINPPLSVIQADLDGAKKRRESAKAQAAIYERQMDRLQVHHDMVAFRLIAKIVSKELPESDLTKEQRQMVESLLRRMSRTDLARARVPSEGRDKRANIARVRVVDATGKTVERYNDGSVSVANYILAHAKEAGFSDQIGSGLDDDGKQMMFHKVSVSKVRPVKGTAAQMLSKQRADGKWQRYYARQGRCETGYYDYIVASVTLPAGYRVDYLDAGNQVIAYHRKDETTGVTYCSETGSPDDEMCRRFVLDEVEYNKEDVGHH